jgi:hypothetical protein
MGIPYWARVLCAVQKWRPWVKVKFRVLKILTSELLLDYSKGPTRMPPLARLFASEPTPKTGACTVGSGRQHVGVSLPPTQC